MATDGDLMDAKESRNKLGLFTFLSAWTEGEDFAEEGQNRRRGRAGRLRVQQAGKQDHELTCKDRLYMLADTEGDAFNIMIGMVIIGNAITIGVQTDAGHKWTEGFHVLQHAFNTVFFLEMCMRIRTLGRAYILDPWNCFDFALVTLGTLDLWILPLVIHFTHPMGGTAVTGSSDAEGHSDLYHFSAIRCLRVLRVFRVLRVIRLLRMFNQLYLLMLAYLKALQVVFIMMGLVLVLDYIIAILLTQMIGKNSDLWGDDAPKIEMWFGTIFLTMQTLFAVTTLSNWEDLAVTLSKVYPVPLTFLVMITYIMLTTYTLMSLVTGVITESLIFSQLGFREAHRFSIDEKRRILATTIGEYLHDQHEDVKTQLGEVSAADLKESVIAFPELVEKLQNLGVNADEAAINGLVDKMAGSKQASTTVPAPIQENKILIDHFAEKLTNLSGPASGTALADLRHEVRKLQNEAVLCEEKIARVLETMR